MDRLGNIVFLQIWAYVGHITKRTTTTTKYERT